MNNITEHLEGVIKYHADLFPICVRLIITNLHSLANSLVASDHLESSSFPSPINPQEPKALSRGNAKRKVVDRQEAAVVLGQVL